MVDYLHFYASNGIIPPINKKHKRGTQMSDFNFLGKAEVLNHHLAVKSSVLVPQYRIKGNSKESIKGGDKTSDLSDNLIIHGDNLLALKALLPTHAGKVNCIYIDPPYNTGEEGWVYNDKVNSSLMKNWLGKVVDSESSDRHDKWLCMMYPRLQILKELLAENGVIFISIDDNEQHHLRFIMDEIFGEYNFEALITWRRRHNQPNDKTKMVAKVAEYITVYAKNSAALKQGKAFSTLPMSKKREEDYKNLDNDDRGKWDTTPWKSASGQGGVSYEITTPTGKKILETWMGTKKTFEELLKDKRIVFSKGKQELPRKKIFWNERVKEGQPAHNFWGHAEFGSNQEGSAQISSILGEEQFNNPKPTRLVKTFINLISDKNAIILDSFAGSGTTAHATLALNKEDGGTRKFILVECEDYANKVTAERVRRVIKGVPTSKDENLKKGLGGTFTYYELGDSIDYEKIIQGKKLPPYDDLARVLFSQATGQCLTGSKIKNKNWLVGETEQYKVYVVYEPDIDFLCSGEAMLTLDFIGRINKQLKDNQEAIVFASGRHVDIEDLRNGKIKFCYLPHEIHKQ